jgi:hypothetical protein
MIGARESKMRGKALVVGWLVGALLLPGAAGAQMYRWVDDRGSVHYSEGIDSVPERYRARAVALPYQKLPTPEPKAPEPSPGITRIPFTPGSPIRVNAKINGAGPVTLLLDTGADRTVVAPLPLWRLGISTRSAQRGEITGVTGTATADLVRVDSVEVGEARVGPLTIMAHDAALQNADGLLGRDFLDRFTVTIDSKAGVVTLAPK